MIFHTKHRPPSPGIKWHHAHAQECAPRSPDTRLLRAGCVAPAVTGAGSAHAPRRSLPRAAAASPSLQRSRTPPSRRDLSQPALTQVGGRHPARRQLAAISRSVTSPACSPDRSAVRNLAVRGQRRRGLGMGTGRRNGPHSAFRSPALLSAAEAWCRGCAKRGAILPSGLNCPAAVSIRLPDRRPVARPDRAHHPAGRTRRSRRRTPRRPAARRPGRRRAAAARCLHAATGTRPAAERPPEPAWRRQRARCAVLSAPYQPGRHPQGRARLRPGRSAAVAHACPATATRPPPR